jgi:hypothetical protein
MEIIDICGRCLIITMVIKNPKILYIMERISTQSDLPFSFPYYRIFKIAKFCTDEIYK